MNNYCMNQLVITKKGGPVLLVITEFDRNYQVIIFYKNPAIFHKPELKNLI